MLLNLLNTPNHIMLRNMKLKMNEVTINKKKNKKKKQTILTQHLFFQKRFLKYLVSYVKWITP